MQSLPIALVKADISDLGEGLAVCITATQFYFSADGQRPLESTDLTAVCLSHFLSFVISTHSILSPWASVMHG